ncbi:hypothetical protein HAV15_001197 [Penicillium sp. str. |nr:hypothetical protein HAV15_001197 [Penicillium sp. str. \
MWWSFGYIVDSCNTAQASLQVNKDSVALCTVLDLVLMTTQFAWAIRLLGCSSMVGIVSNRQSASDYDDDMKRAQYAVMKNAYKTALNGKPYIASVSPWFSTHFGGDVSYIKNWVFPSGLLWYNRWREILATSPRFVELLTWNDYGESHYIDPLSSPHIDDGASKWVMGM